MATFQRSQIPFHKKAINMYYIIEFAITEDQILLAWNMNIVNSRTHLLCSHVPDLMMIGHSLGRLDALPLLQKIQIENKLKRALRTVCVDINRSFAWFISTTINHPGNNWTRVILCFSPFGSEFKITHCQTRLKYVSVFWSYARTNFCFHCRVMWLFTFYHVSIQNEIYFPMQKTH